MGDAIQSTQEKLNKFVNGLDDEEKGVMVAILKRAELSESPEVTGHTLGQLLGGATSAGTGTVFGTAGWATSLPVQVSIPGMGTQTTSGGQIISEATAAGIGAAGYVLSAPTPVNVLW